MGAKAVLAWSTPTRGQGSQAWAKAHVQRKTDALLEALDRTQAVE